MIGILGDLQFSISVSTSRNKEGNYLKCQRIMSIAQHQSMNPVVPMMDFTQEPTCGQLNDWTMTVLPEDWRLDDWVLHVGHWSIVCWVRKVKVSWWDLSTVLGSLLSSSQPTNHITRHYHSLLSQPTGRSEDHISTGTIVLFFVMTLTTSYAYESVFYV